MKAGVLAAEKLHLEGECSADMKQLKALHTVLYCTVPYCTVS